MRSVIDRARALRLALLVAALVAVGVGAGTSLGRGEDSGAARGEIPPLRDPNYVGKLIGEPNGRALLRVEPKGSGTRRVVFQAQNIRRICESGDVETTFKAFPDPVGPSGRWESLFSDGPPDSTQTSSSR